MPRPQSVLKILAHPAVLVYLMPALMGLLLIGTITQAQMGLYEAHKTYFSSFVFWVGPLPLPGGYTLLGVLTLNLLVKFLFFSEWRWRKAGIILSHFGALVLLIGGLLTALTAQEGFMVIEEGGQSPYVYDYHKKDLMIYEGDRLQYTLPFKDLKNTGPVEGLTNLPFQIEILSACDNCAIGRREEVQQNFIADDTPLQGMAQFMALSPKKKEREAEMNLSGLTLRISGRPDQEDGAAGIYVIFDGMPKPIILSAGDRDYRLMFGKQQRTLPFQIRLQDFQKQTYPGYPLARAYSSDVVIVEGLSEWESRIEMNKPLRYQGYTFYQSSFEEAPQGSDQKDLTILSVVENQGRIFPYLGTMVLMTGLILHSVIRRRSKDRPHKKDRRRG